MSIYNLRGIVVPMVTPLTENENIDLDKTQRITEYLITGGVQGIFLLGSTGEFCSLNLDEKLKFVKKVVDTNDKRIKLLVGVSESGTRKTLEMIKMLSDCGIDAAVVTPPYYYPLKQQAIIDHYEYLAARTNIPLVLYNIPLTTGVEIKVDTIINLAKDKVIKMIKDSSGDFIYFQDLLNSIQEISNCRVFQGHENLALVSLFIGADGLVPALGNIVPGMYVELFKKITEASYDDALLIQKRINELLEIYNYGSVYSAIKEALNYLNITGPYVTKPLQYPDQIQKNIIRNKIDIFKKEDLL
jgi:4-hydroxy-tetrahydrodipicolinate synthase